MRDCFYQTYTAAEDDGSSKISCLRHPCVYPNVRRLHPRLRGKIG